MSARLRTHLGEKLLLTVILSLWVCVPYFSLQHRFLFPARPMPSTFFDELIQFNAGTVWGYQSLYLLTPIAPFLMTSRDALRRYALGLAGISLLCDLIFLFAPTAGPERPDPALLNAGYRLLVAMDSTRHAFPSLHAALAVYSALCVRQIFGGPGAEKMARLLTLTWSGGIVYCTLSTKQHVLPDAVAGVALGTAVYWLVFNSTLQGGNVMAEAREVKRYAKIGLWAAGAALLATIGYTAVTNVGDKYAADRQALLKLKDVYELALNNDQIDLLAPYLDKDFSATLATGAEITSMAEWKAHWAQLKGLIGIGSGGSYKVTLKPVLGGSFFVGDYAFSYGTTEELVTTASNPNEQYKFSSTWGAVSRKRHGSWKLSAARASILNPENIFRPDQLKAVQDLVVEFQQAQAKKDKGG